MKKPETSATFSCSQCGECCRHINLVPALAAFDTGTGVCKYLAGNLCSIYDTRPLICRVDAMYYADSDEEGEVPCCESCYQRKVGGALHSYSYKPAPVFYGGGPLYLGVELEVDGAGKSASNAREILNVMNRRAESLLLLPATGIQSASDAHNQTSCCRIAAVRIVYRRP